MKKTAQWRFEVKSVDSERREIAGIATSPTPDRVKDVLNPFGARYAKSIPLFLYHDSTKSVGRAELGKPTSKGIPFNAAIPKVREEGVLKDRVDEAWQMLKYELIDAVSVGFSPDEGKVSLNKQGGLDFDAYEILELSLVPIPMQPEAVIQHIKSIDAKAAPGRNPRRDHPPPGASGTQTKPPSGGFFSPVGKGNTMKTMEMQVSDLRATRDTNAKRMEELLGLKQAESRQFSDEERNEFDGLKASITDLNDAIAVKEALCVEARSAKPVEARSHGASYGFVRKADPEDKFQGQAHTRRLIARALAHISMKQGEFQSAAEIAEHRWGRTNPNLVATMKAGVAGAGSGSGEAWAELVAMDGRFTGDFIEYLYSMTVYDRLPLREIPANVTVKGQDGVATGYFVGESKAIPASVASGSTVNLTPLKVGAISVVSNELLADSTPSAEMLIRDSLVQAASQKIDNVFLSTSAASAGVSPAGILNGLSAGGSAGNTPAHVIADIQALLANFITGKYASDLYIVTSPTLAAALGMMVNSLGLPAFPNSTLTQKGGTFQGYPVVTGHNVGSGDVIMLSPRDIWKIGDSGVQISVSQEAMIEQDSAPTGETDTPTAASATLTSMFQEESTAFKIVRRINWKLRRADAVTYIGDASYNLGS